MDSPHSDASAPVRPRQVDTSPRLVRREMTTPTKIRPPCQSTALPPGLQPPADAATKTGDAVCTDDAITEIDDALLKDALSANKTRKRKNREYDDSDLDAAPSPPKTPLSANNTSGRETETKSQKSLRSNNSRLSNRSSDRTRTHRRTHGNASDASMPSYSNEEDANNAIMNLLNGSRSSGTSDDSFLAMVRQAAEQTHSPPPGLSPRSDHVRQSSSASIPSYANEEDANNAILGLLNATRSSGPSDDAFMAMVRQQAEQETRSQRPPPGHSPRSSLLSSFASHANEEDGFLNATRSSRPSDASFMARGISLSPPPGFSPPPRSPSASFLNSSSAAQTSSRSNEPSGADLARPIVDRPMPRASATRRHQNQRDSASPPASPVLSASILAPPTNGSNSSGASELSFATYLDREAAQRHLSNVSPRPSPPRANQRPPPASPPASSANSDAAVLALLNASSASAAATDSFLALVRQQTERENTPTNQSLSPRASPSPPPSASSPKSTRSTPSRSSRANRFSPIARPSPTQSPRTARSATPETPPRRSPTPLRTGRSPSPPPPNVTLENLETDIEVALKRLARVTFAVGTDTLDKILALKRGRSSCRTLLKKAQLGEDVADKAAALKKRMTKVVDEVATYTAPKRR